MVAFRSPILQDLERAGDMNALQQAQALYSEWEHRVTARAHRRGIEQGLEQGREEATRALLVRLMTQRFGPLPRKVSARIRRAGEASLMRWADRVLTAESIDDVLD